MHIKGQGKLLGNYKSLNLFKSSIMELVIPVSRGILGDRSVKRPSLVMFLMFSLWGHSDCISNKEQFLEILHLNQLCYLESFYIPRVFSIFFYKSSIALFMHKTYTVEKQLLFSKKKQYSHFFLLFSPRFQTSLPVIGIITEIGGKLSAKGQFGIVFNVFTLGTQYFSVKEQFLEILH